MDIEEGHSLKVAFVYDAICPIKSDLKRGFTKLEESYLMSMRFTGMGLDGGLKITVIKQ